jgi:hypothetical protein
MASLNFIEKSATNMVWFEPRDFSQRVSLSFKSILYKNGWGLNPQDYCQEVCEKRGQGMSTETTKMNSLLLKSILYRMAAKKVCKVTVGHPF